MKVVTRAVERLLLAISGLFGTVRRGSALPPKADIGGKGISQSRTTIGLHTVI